MGDDETLLVLSDVFEPGILESVGKVVHQISDRVLVVRLDDESLDLVSHDPRVVYVGDEPPLDVIEGLGDQERLFVDGWLARGRQAERTGDGLSWDAEGMSPPDLPRHPRRS